MQSCVIPVTTIAYADLGMRLVPLTVSEKANSQRTVSVTVITINKARRHIEK